MAVVFVDLGQYRPGFRLNICGYTVNRARGEADVIRAGFGWLAGVDSLGDCFKHKFWIHNLSFSKKRPAGRW